MATKKNDLFTEQEQKLAVLFNALSHPARISIIKFLAANNKCICGEIVNELPLAQSTVSQHLKELKKAGLIKGEISGPKTCYCINWDTINLMKNNFDELFIKIKIDNKNACC